MRSTPELPPSADKGAFDPFFSAIGRLVVSWSDLERALDMIIRLVHRGTVVPRPESEPDLPRALERKVTYVRKVNTSHLTNTKTATAFENVLTDLERRADFRHKIIHGYIVGFDEAGFGAQFERLHRTKLRAPIERYYVEIEEISAEAILVQDLARLLYLIHSHLVAAERTQAK